MKSGRGTGKTHVRTRGGAERRKTGRDGVRSRNGSSGSGKTPVSCAKTGISGAQRRRKNRNREGSRKGRGSAEGRIRVAFFGSTCRVFQFSVSRKRRQNLSQISDQLVVFYSSTCRRCHVSRKKRACAGEKRTAVNGTAVSRSGGKALTCRLFRVTLSQNADQDVAVGKTELVAFFRSDCRKLRKTGDSAPISRPDRVNPDVVGAMIRRERNPAAGGEGQPGCVTVEIGEVVTNVCRDSKQAGGILVAFFRRICRSFRDCGLSTNTNSSLFSYHLVGITGDSAKGPVSACEYYEKEKL